MLYYSQYTKYTIHLSINHIKRFKIFLPSQDLGRILRFFMINKLSLKLCPNKSELFTSHKSI